MNGLRSPSTSRFLDLLYLSVGQSETQNGVSVSTGLQEEGIFEFGGTYRLGPVSLGQAGRLTFEPLAGGRFMWVHASLGGPNQKVSESVSVIDPRIGGRIAYHITDTVALTTSSTCSRAAGGQPAHMSASPATRHSVPCAPYFPAMAFSRRVRTALTSAA